VILEIQQLINDLKELNGELPYPEDSYIKGKRDDLEKHKKQIEILIEHQKNKLIREGEDEEEIIREAEDEEEKRKKEKAGPSSSSHQSSRTISVLQLKNILKNNPKLEKEIKTILVNELTTGEIEEEDYNEILSELPKIKGEHYKKLAKEAMIQKDISNAVQQEALNKLIKGEISQEDYIDIRNANTKPVIATSSFKKIIKTPINYKIQRKIITH
jgi:hypothetical protein